MAIMEFYANHHDGKRFGNGKHKVCLPNGPTVGWLVPHDGKLVFQSSSHCIRLTSEQLQAIAAQLHCLNNLIP